MTEPPVPPSREELAFEYLDRLPYTPYPVQEQAIFAWFEHPEGVLVSAPTGTGKTLIAEAVVFEALRTGRRMYYTTPLIALTEQKFRELTETAVRWGYRPEDVGLVTGNRRVNPDAPVLVVVAEILLNRLLQPELFDFGNVLGVVMDEFHSFSDPERGIVWEFSLSLLPAPVRVLLLSATVGNAVAFLRWLHTCHGRNLQLVQSSDRKVPLSFRWAGDQTLNELVEEMAAGEDAVRQTPALVFCFSRDECWNVGEELKGKALLADGQQKLLSEQLARHDWTKGAGPKLKQILLRGIGVHHAGILPRYRRIVEEFFQQRLLTVCICTETLSAGINLPARSVVVPCLLKGPPGKQKLIDPSSAHQIFGRAGRPQYDDQGFVLALPHEDDVKILRWKEKYDQIPEDTKDPNLIKAKKAIKKKQPTRSPNRQYWNESQFEKLRTASSRDLVSQGHLPWRMLAYMLQLSPDVDRLRTLVRKRLMDPQRIAVEERELDAMLLTLHAAGVVQLEPSPPAPTAPEAPANPETETPPTPKLSPMARLIVEALQAEREARGEAPLPKVVGAEKPTALAYTPHRALPTSRLREFFLFRSINPVYAMFLLDHLALASEVERLQALESVLELPRSIQRFVRVPSPERLPPGPLATERVDQQVVARGLIAAGDLYPEWDPDARFEDRKWPPTLADKLRMLFESEYPNVHGVQVTPVWVAPNVLQFEGNFFSYVTSHDLTKHEGLIFRHLLRLILLLGEFSQATPTGMDPAEWQSWLKSVSDRLTLCCKTVDPTSTEQTLTHFADSDFVPRELTGAPPPGPLDPAAAEEAVEEAFGLGLEAGD